MLQSFIISDDVRRMNYIANQISIERGNESTETIDLINAMLSDYRTYLFRYFTKLGVNTIMFRATRPVEKRPQSERYKRHLENAMNFAGGDHCVTEKHVVMAMILNDGVLSEFLSEYGVDAIEFLRFVVSDSVR